MLRAVLFDLDGVLTPTAEVHMRAWERLFAPFCAARGLAPYTDADYFAHIDGKPRFDGVRTMLASRGVELPRADRRRARRVDRVRPGQPKNEIFNAMFVERGRRPLPGLCPVPRRRDRAPVRTSPSCPRSRNAPSVLAAAGIADRFEVVVDGAVAERDGLRRQARPRHLPARRRAARRDRSRGDRRRGRPLGRPVRARRRLRPRARRRPRRRSPTRCSPPVPTSWSPTSASSTVRLTG